MRDRNAYASLHIFKSSASKDARNADVKIPCADTSEKAYITMTQMTKLIRALVI